MNQKSLTNKLKKRNLLWFSGLLVLILSLYGIGYGVWICYNGILIKDTTSEALLSLLEKSTMSIQDGMYAMIGFGTVIIIYYLLLTGLGVLGMLSSNRLLVKQTLFWFTIILMSISIFFGFLGILSWTLVGVNIVCLGFYIIAVFRKYNIDLNRVQKKKQDESF